jgi:tetratricopeptide (TPR) repeat protein
MKIINRSNLILMIIMAAVLIAALVFAGGCRDKNAAADQESAGQEEAAEQTKDTGTTAEEDIQNGGQEEEKSSEEAEAAEEENGGEAEIEEEEEIPEEISSEIEQADSYFDDGMYSEAVKGYRDAQRAIEDSELAADKKEELLTGIDANYQQSSNISDTARIHHTNAMTLDYEKRYEEAKAELEAALAIYPKYQAAIDALDSLEALMGLK